MSIAYSVAVVEALCFGRAPENLGLTAAPVPGHRPSRERAGVPLLESTTRQVTLTDADEVFLAECRAILAALDTAVREARRDVVDGDVLVDVSVGLPRLDQRGQSGACAGFGVPVDRVGAEGAGGGLDGVMGGGRLRDAGEEVADLVHGARAGGETFTGGFGGLGDMCGVFGDDETRYASGFGARPLIALRRIVSDRAFDTVISHAVGLPT
ncbi:hypothetical protein ABZT34_24955 [Streptomyces sp. NPDC005329]|uniref:hypothetical protein n=1 Tax=Streptomyces sp. NPDC005329 TaxID=3157034 RepID=UPI0033B8EAD5